MRHALLTLCNCYPAFGIAWATDADGGRFLINEGTSGVLVETLQPNDVLSCWIGERNYVVRAEWPAGETKEG